MFLINFELFKLIVS